MKREENTPKTKEAELNNDLQEEVNGNAFCNTHLKTACLCDCLDGTAWLSTAN